MRRKTDLANGEYYHIMNRGIEGRNIFCHSEDYQRFLYGMVAFNSEEPTQSLFEDSRKSHEELQSRVAQDPLVEIVAYCLNNNHFHFIVKQVAETGISQWMHKLQNGYAKYFNYKYERKGPLFQGPFKVVHVSSNAQLLHVSAYVNLNYVVHGISAKYKNINRSSWTQYLKGSGDIVIFPGAVLGQFNKSIEYEEYARTVVEEIHKRRFSENIPDDAEMHLE